MRADRIGFRREYFDRAMNRYNQDPAYWLDIAVRASGKGWAARRRRGFALKKLLALGVKVEFVRKARRVAEEAGDASKA